MDGAVPSPEEVEDLLQIGRRIAIAIEQSNRSALLQSALDKIPEPVLIVDHLERLQYANKPAVDRLGVDSGWRDPDKSQPLPAAILGEAHADLREALTERRRLVRTVSSLGLQRKQRAAKRSHAQDHRFRAWHRGAGCRRRQHFLDRFQVEREFLAGDFERDQHFRTRGNGLRALDFRRHGSAPSVFSICPNGFSDLTAAGSACILSK